MAKKEFTVGGPRATFVLLVCSSLYMINYMDRQVLAVVLEPMKLDLGLTDSQAGLIQTGFLISMGLFAIPISFLVDRWSRNKAIAVMALFWSAMTFITGLGRNFLGVFLPRIFTGTGEAAFSSGSIALISASYPPEVRARKLAIYNMFLIFGVAGGMVLGGYLSANHGGWRTPFFVFAIPGFILGVMAWFLQDYPTPKSDAAGPGFLDNFKELMKVRTLCWLYVGYGMNNLMSFSILVWAAALIMRKFNVGEDTAGLVMSSTGVLAVPGVLLGGVMADRWQARHHAGRMRFAALSALASAVGIIIALILAFLIHPDGSRQVSLCMVLGVLGYALYAIGSIAGIPAINAATQDVVPARLKGLSYGLAVFYQYLLGGGWSPYVAGFLSDRFGGGAAGLSLALIVTGSAGFLAAATWWTAGRHYAADVERAGREP